MLPKSTLRTIGLYDRDFPRGGIAQATALLAPLHLVWYTSRWPYLRHLLPIITRYEDRLPEEIHGDISIKTGIQAESSIDLIAMTIDG